MNRILLSLAALSLLAGCGRAALSSENTTPTSPDTAPRAPATAKDDPTEGLEGQELASTGGRTIGDFVVYKFSGSFHNKPITLTERVVAKKGDTILIDFALEDGASKEELLVKMSEAPSKRNEILGVSKVEGGVAKPAGLPAFDALMAKTALAADQNESMISREETSLDVGGSRIPCTTSTFRVKVGRKAATMKTIESPAFAWGDVGGEITAQNGKTLYKAEVVEVGHSDNAPAVANSDLDE